MRQLTVSCLVMLTALVGCNMEGGAPGSASSGMASGGASASASLSDASGAPRGTARLVPQGDAVRLTFEGQGLPPGERAIHVHTVGRCDGPGFTTAGEHWNPTAMKHGAQNPQGPHRGDMPNLTVGADGTTRYEATLSGAMLTGAGGLMDGDGAAVIVHASPDDYRTDPSGNAGARIACGVVQSG